MASARRHPYQFAHRLLPEVWFADPMRVMDRLSGPGGRAWLDDQWQELGDLYGAEALTKVDLRYSFEPLGGPWQLALVKLPPPQAPSECWFAALAWRPAQPGWLGFVASSPQARYLLMEQNDAGEPFMAEWYQDGTRREHTEIVNPSKQAFVDVLKLQLA